jgi:hypothetical protein
MICQGLRSSIQCDVALIAPIDLEDHREIATAFRGSSGEVCQNTGAQVIAAAGFEVISGVSCQAGLDINASPSEK